MAHVHQPVVRAVDHQRRDVDALDHMAHVDVEEHLDHRSQHSRARARSLEPREPGAGLGVICRARPADLDDRSFAPVRGEQLDPRSDQVLGRQRPRIVGRVRGAGQAAVAHERLHAARVCGGEQDAHRGALGDAEQGGPLRAGRVHHGAHVVHALLERRRLRDRVRQPGPATVEVDDARERAQALQNRGRPLVLPHQLDVARIAVDQYEIEVARAEHLVGDVHVAAARVARLGSGAAAHQPGAKYRVAAESARSRC